MHTSPRWLSAPFPTLNVSSCSKDLVTLGASSERVPSRGRVFVRKESFEGRAPARGGTSRGSDVAVGVVFEHSLRPRARGRVETSYPGRTIALRALGTRTLPNSSGVTSDQESARRGPGGALPSCNDRTPTRGTTNPHRLQLLVPNRPRRSSRNLGLPMS